MTDNLRDRIAAAIRRDKIGRTQLHSYEADLLADAVIAELYPQRRCRLCGREGTQKFAPYRDGWICRSVHACEMRRHTRT